MASIQNWLLAARLRTLPLSVSGIIVGASFGQDFLNNALYFSETNYSLPYYKTILFWLAILTTIGFQVLSNFANDYGDALKGTDKNRIGEQRMVATGLISAKQMKNAMMLIAVLTFISVLVLVYVSFGQENFLFSALFIILGIVAIVAAIKYTVGKNAYGYTGFGDIFVFLFFGLVSVLGSYFLYTQHFFLDIILPACSIGFFSMAVLNLNNMRDITNDSLQNKNTLVVLLGIKKAKKYHYFLLISGVVCAILYTSLHFQSIKQFVYIIAFIPMVLNIKKVYLNTDSKLLDAELKKIALSTFVFALLFSLLH